MTAIQSKYVLNNRSAKHRYRNEATRAVAFLQPIIDDFVDTVFNAPTKFNYRIIYMEFLDKWNQACEYLLTKCRPLFKVIEVDHEYFTEEFAPEQLDKKKFPERMGLIIF